MDPGLGREPPVPEALLAAPEAARPRIPEQGRGNLPKDFSQVALTFS